MSMPTLPQTGEQLLAQMVAIDSVNPRYGGPVGGEADLAAHLETLAQAWGLRTRRCPVGTDGSFNLIVAAPEMAGAEWLIFESHLDTVSYAGMVVPPLTLTETDGRLFGRGACDTKASGAAMLWALQAWAATPGRCRNAAIAFVVDEEAGMTGAQAFARDDLARYAPLRGVIVGEPTRLRPVVSHNGAFRWRSVTRGVAAHSADPTKGRSAIRAMMAVVAALEERMIPLANRESPFTGRAAASINVIRGGSAQNIIPDRCEILCDRRLVPGETLEQVITERERALEGLDVEHDDEYLAPPLPPENSAALHRWMTSALTGQGLDATAVGAPYATDASHYAAAGAQVVVIGPGDLAQAHCKDEWLERDQFVRAIALYRAMLDLPAS
ncbi:MAG: M20 family metallopeptidase [Verrucomicrobia bacterium]|nr:M20 family metallopeptidase [Verrucomicrobiota bacterium]